jgi:hypothetical protein
MQESGFLSANDQRRAPRRNFDVARVEEIQNENCSGGRGKASWEKFARLIGVLLSRFGNQEL